MTGSRALSCLSKLRVRTEKVAGRRGGVERGGQRGVYCRVWGLTAGAADDAERLDGHVRDETKP